MLLSISFALIGLSLFAMEVASPGFFLGALGVAALGTAAVGALTNESPIPMLAAFVTAAGILYLRRRTFKPSGKPPRRLK